MCSECGPDGEVVFGFFGVAVLIGLISLLLSWYLSSYLPSEDDDEDEVVIFVEEAPVEEAPESGSRGDEVGAGASSGAAASAVDAANVAGADGAGADADVRGVISTPATPLESCCARMRTLVLLIIGYVTIARAWLGMRAKAAGQWVPVSAPRQCMTVVKILVGYLQTIDVFPRYANVVWPNIFLRFVKALNLSQLIGVEVWVGNLLMPIECSVRFSFYARLLCTLLLPPLFSAFIFTLAFLVHMRSGKPLAARAALFRSPGVINLHLWIVLLLYPSLCRVTLDAFQCTSYISDTGERERAPHDQPPRPPAAPLHGLQPAHCARVCVCACASHGA